MVCSALKANNDNLLCIFYVQGDLFHMCTHEQSHTITHAGVCMYIFFQQYEKMMRANAPWDFHVTTRGFTRFEVPWCSKPKVRKGIFLGLLRPCAGGCARQTSARCVLEQNHELQGDKSR